MENTKLEEIEVELSYKYYDKFDIKRYSGYTIDSKIMVGISGIELPLNRKIKLMGIMGNYKGDKSFEARYEIIDTKSHNAQLNLLCDIKGVKEKTALKIINILKDDNIDFEQLQDNNITLKGVGIKTMENIRQGIRQLLNNRNKAYLISIIGKNLSKRKIDLLNAKIENIEDFKKDPYSIMLPIGIGFKIADRIAINCVGIDVNSDLRGVYFTEYITKEATSKGHTYISKIELLKLINFEGFNLTLEKINEFIMNENSKVVEIENENIQLKIYLKAEKEIPVFLNEIKNKKYNDLNENELLSMIKEFESNNDIELHETQILAILSSIKNNVSLINGSAGTGKTTIIRCILNILTQLNYNHICIAPTGKASRRMSQSTGRNAVTCHRFYLGVDQGKFDNYLHSKNLLIIDEFSMVDTILMYRIMEATKALNNSFYKIIFVGDQGQLPSVGAGNFMFDLIKSNFCNIVTLTKIFRQKNSNNNIIDIANNVRENKTFEIVQCEDFNILLSNNIEKSEKCKNSNIYNIDDYVAWCFFCNTNFENIYTLKESYNNFQLCTFTNGDCSIINNMISTKIDNAKIFDKYLKNFKFRLHDKVLNTKNDYENMVYNGEFGIITGLTYELNTFLGTVERTISNKDKIVEFYLDIKNKKIEVKEIYINVEYTELDIVVKYNLEELDNLQLAYCATVHKLQGSEYEKVLFFVKNYNVFIDSRLLYTAITRATKKVILAINDKKTLDKIVKNKNSSFRNTMQQQRFLEFFEGEKHD